MVAFNKFECLSEHIAEKIHDFDADTLKVYLSNAAPNAATHTVKATGPAEIAGGNGYTGGGHDTQNVTSRTGTVTSVVGTDIVITATGAIGPFQYAILYNDTPAAGVVDPLIGWWAYASPITMAATETFTIDFGTSMFTVT